MHDNTFYVYILTAKRNTALYTGVINNLLRRLAEHKQDLGDSWVKRYNANKLVYFELFDDPETAIRREKQLKGGSRQKKIDLINAMNPDWKELTDML
ncbi:GIY-YIG nuclease family protein [bacterium]|nr:GIY-YIG nuclease family protein [bacterium]MBU1652178.1 GIY-YIG nuclease family protein [bacterium]